MRRIYEIRDSVNIVLDELSLGRRLLYQSNTSPDLKGIKLLPGKDIPPEVKKHLERATQSSERLHQAITKIENLSFSFGKEGLSDAKEFLVAVHEYASLHTKNPKEKGNEEKWFELCLKAGKFQGVLREKLISLRE